MNRLRGFFIFDLTLAIVLMVVVASMFAHVVWLYNHDSARLALVRDAARVEQAVLYQRMARSDNRIGNRWVIKRAAVADHARAGLPTGSRWIVIRPAGKGDAPALYALRVADIAKKAGGGK